ncbi:MAG: hypothetical protein IAG10_23915 [Planctomycetaceae bacterium]|nr:hypothetical protein [Planctomycetaceae bacterium]
MNSVRQFLWKLLVAGMIPFILGAGLPQRECQRAMANGQHFSGCCFRNSGESRSEDSSLKPCCRKRKASPELNSPSCPTCQGLSSPETGSCCSLKQIAAPTLSQQVEVSQLEVATMWLPLLVGDWQSPAISRTAREDAWSRAYCERPPLDRVIVFEHLVI